MPIEHVVTVERFYARQGKVVFEILVNGLARRIITANALFSTKEFLALQTRSADEREHAAVLTAVLAHTLTNRGAVLAVFADAHAQRGQQAPNEPLNGAAISRTRQR